MENPQFPINLIGGQWNKIATNINGAGTIHKKTKDVDYLQTYRLTGETAPTDISEGVLMFLDYSYEPFGVDSAVDIYVWASKDAVLRLDR